MVSTSRCCSRRQFLTLLGGGAAGCALAACGSPAQSAKGANGPTAKFVSRPDLHPALVDVTGPFGRPGGGYAMITAGGPMILDNRGSPVWFRPVPHASTNLQVQRYQGQPVLTWWEGEITHYGVGKKGVVVMADSSYREVMRVKAVDGLQADLHDFVIAGDGTGYLIAYREITGDLSAVGGPRRGTMLDCVIQGIDLETGTLEFEWHSADHITVKESYRKYSSSSDAPFDPVHLNSVDPTADGNLLVSARHTWTVYKLDRATGKILWHLGGKNNDFTRGPGVHFAWQHDAQSHPGNLLSLFDNEADPAEAAQSRGLILKVTETKRTATLVRAYPHPHKKLLAGSQGSMQLLSNGDVFIGWGAEPYYTELRRDGMEVLDGHISRGQSYRAFRFPWTGTPTDRPAIATRRRGRSRLTVYASWNGATEVASWTVLGGSASADLSEVGAADRTGFETSIDVRAPTVRVVAARAIDRDGNVLATSAVRRV